MKSFAVLAGAGLLALSGVSAMAQSGRPASPFPYAAPHEVRDGCRTVHIEGTTSRVPVECAEPLATGSVGVAPGQPMAPGAIMVAPGAPAAAYPYAAPHEVRNGCRTVLIQGTNQRVPVDC